jgi:hypothetical protein
MLYLLLWALLLVAQNASFTWVSRARNSGSDWYHGFAAVFSNGIWFAATFITFERVWTVLKTGNVGLGILIGAIYVAATVTGSVSAGMFLRKYVEKGKRKVGHYEEHEVKINGLSYQMRSLAADMTNVVQWQQRLVDGALASQRGEPRRQGEPRFEQIERKLVLHGDEIAQIIEYQRRFMDEYCETPSGDLIHTGPDPEAAVRYEEGRTKGELPE